MTQQPAPLVEAGHGRDGAVTADGTALGLCRADVRAGGCDPESLGPHLSEVLRRNFLASVRILYGSGPRPPSALGVWVTSAKPRATEF